MKDTIVYARRGKKRALIAGHSQLISVYLILSTGSRYHELGAQYMQSKIEQKRKVYLSSELKKLGYNVSLTKVPQAVTPINNTDQRPTLLELP